MNDSKIILYIASSLDGYIAREDDSIDWLHELENPDQSDYGYNEFMAGIDTLVMGRRTYEVVTAFDLPWPYKDVRSIVISSKQDLQISTPDTIRMDAFDRETVERIRSESKKHVWLMGGGQLVTRGLELGIIDEIILCIIPRVLGNGIPLFAGQPPDTLFDLTDCTSYAGGAVILTYQPKKS